MASSSSASSIDVSGVWNDLLKELDRLRVLNTGFVTTSSALSCAIEVLCEWDADDVDVMVLLARTPGGIGAV
jgi:hypothetical protein